jgi:hypothetical protein
LTWKGFWRERLRRGSLYIDSNVFIYPIIYDENVVEELGGLGSFS